jgi:hypothetical protein
MDAIARVVEDEVSYTTAGLASGLLQASMSIQIKCDCYDLKFNGHLFKGGSVNGIPYPIDEYADEIKVNYTSGNFGTKFEGMLACQVQSSESELLDDTFIIVLWEVLRFGSVRIYTVLVETMHKGIELDWKFMKDFHKSSYSQLRKYTKPIEESWSLVNNTKIKLITDLRGDKDYCLRITTCRDKPRDEDANYPIRVAPER